MPESQPKVCAQIQLLNAVDWSVYDRGLACHPRCACTAQNGLVLVKRRPLLMLQLP